MSEENNEKKVTPPEEYTALKMAKNVIDRLLKIIVILIVCIVVIVAGFLVFIHFTATTTLTTEPDSTGIITGNESPVTTYPSMTTNTNTNK